MTVIDIKGDVVDDDTARLYDYVKVAHVNPAAIHQQLASANGEDVTLNVASNGGDVFSAAEIYSSIKAYSGNVNVVIQGLAASAASVIAMSGDKISMSPTSMLMIHRASTAVAGNSDDMAHQSEVMDNVDKSIAAAYEAKTGMSEGDLLNLMSHETWLTAKDAVDKGFADEIMFVDESKPLVTNSVASIPSKAAVNKLLNLLNKVPDEEPAPKQPNNENKPTLRDRKLAILLHKN